MTSLADIRVGRKIESSEYRSYARGSFFARFDPGQIFLFVDGHWFAGFMGFVLIAGG
jgi:hypothetical protein